ncbi:hypothetical protein P5673_016889 [Acropora cervicornis]|uniref:Uncharacterized protein n=1 Tax=Acropora cervicornis TaxID=6130 RepID=A0AAD9QFW3_ACRCE|nr:hypothetical protein P5673_016889 [Acropora cervicornis]
MAGISESRVDLLIRPARFNLTNILLSKLSLYGNLVNPVEILKQTPRAGGFYLPVAKHALKTFCLLSRRANRTTSKANHRVISAKRFTNETQCQSVLHSSERNFQTDQLCSWFLPETLVVPRQMTDSAVLRISDHICRLTSPCSI